MTTSLSRVGRGVLDGRLGPLPLPVLAVGVGAVLGSTGVAGVATIQVPAAL